MREIVREPLGPSFRQRRGAALTPAMLLGCIADDFTGASDVANTLARGGMRTRLFAGPPGAPAADCEAGVVALKTRSVAADDAMRQSLAALAWLRAAGCGQVLFKYCSTFDSTPQGNIGPVAEALLDELGAPFAVVCPAFPATGRTVYCGHLFVGDRLLNELGMERHPLNPMTDPDIRRWLRRQTRGEVGWVPMQAVRGGSAAIRAALEGEAAAGRRLIVVDAVADDDLRRIGAAVEDCQLVTGGSGVAIGLPDNFRRKGRLRLEAERFPGLPGPAAILSGSCSAASRAQAAAHGRRHPGLAVDPAAVLTGTLGVEEAAAFVARHRDDQPIVFSTAEPAAVAAVQSRFGADAVARALERFFADLAARLVEAGVERLVVGGGETSGAVVAALGLTQFEIGPEIDPGVPALATRSGPRALRLALKSGNFGSEAFYEKALDALEAR